MRIIHCADIHLDSALSAHLGRERARGRRNEILNTFRKIFGYAAENDVQAVIIAGDLFDSETVSATTINVVLGEIAKYADIDVFYLRGNHDPDESLFAGRRLPENLYLFGDEWTQYQLKGSHIVIAGAVLNDENCNSIYDELELDENDINIVTLHGQEQEYGRARNMNDVCLKKLRGRGIDYLALGHVHGRKLESLDHRGVYCYPGCLEGRGFDELGDKGFLAGEVSPEEAALQFIPFARRRYRIMEVDATEGDPAETALAAIPQGWSEDVCRIVLTGSPAAPVRPERIETALAGRFYALQVRDKTTARQELWERCGEDTLRGLFLRNLRDRCGDDPQSRRLMEQAAAFGLAAIDDREV